MNTLDRMIAAVSPQRAVKRAAARRKLEILDSGYSNYGASQTKNQCWAGCMAAGPQRGYTREPFRPPATLPRPLHGRSVGDGCAENVPNKCCRRGVAAEKVKSTMKRWEWTKKPPATLNAKSSGNFPCGRIPRPATLNGWTISMNCNNSLFLNWLMSGDVIATLPVTKRVNCPYDLRICLIEADRLSNPNGTVDPHFVGGVETNDAGEVIAYHISKAPSVVLRCKRIRVDAVEAWGAKTGRRNVLHIMNRERIGQRRGVPFLAPVIEALKQLGRYTDAELVAAVVSGMFTVFIEKESASSDGTFGEIIPEEAQVDAGDDSTIELAPGAIVDLNEGEKAHDMNSRQAEHGV